MAYVKILAERECLRLVKCGTSFAVVEIRDGRAYPTNGPRGHGYPGSPKGIAQAASDTGLTDEISARTVFYAETTREEELGERMW